jgi:hypothetical protein
VDVSFTQTVVVLLLLLVAAWVLGGALVLPGCAVLLLGPCRLPGPSTCDDVMLFVE